ncbi:hypothetical protein Hanom_Chr02g00169461 [Helianthus anomalus]
MVNSRPFSAPSAVRRKGRKVNEHASVGDIKKSKVHEWSLWLIEILDLVPSFSNVHGWSLWFALYQLVK